MVSVGAGNWLIAIELDLFDASVDNSQCRWGYEMTWFLITDIDSETFSHDTRCRDIVRPLTIRKKIITKYHTTICDLFRKD